ncbi:MAG: hypothetical protein Q9216_003298 [Gyalolechia sp. 2 TL-2023]
MEDNKEAGTLESSPDGKPTQYGGMINDPEMDGLTLYEKKALLVNRELDSHGMGKYQWCLVTQDGMLVMELLTTTRCIFFLCGMGYMVDLLYAQAFGLVEPPMEQELGFSVSQGGDLFSSFNAGLCAGAFVWGVLVDIIGRQYAFNLTFLITSVFGLCLGAPSNYDAILVLTAFVGFGVGGNIPIDTTITLEFLPQNRRFLLALLSVFQPIGVVVCSGIAYGFVPKYACGTGGLGADGEVLQACSKVDAGQPCCGKASNMGWRYLLFTLGAICLFIFFLRFVVFRFQESPKYLLYRGKDEKAVEVMHRIAKFNGRQSTITLEAFVALTDEDTSIGAGTKQLNSSFGEKAKIELARYKLLFANSTITRLTVLVWITYMFDYWGFSIAGSLLPKILLNKNREIDVSTEETYRNYVIIYVCGIPGVLLGALMYGVPLVGRQWGMIVSSALMGASLFIFSAINTQASNVGINIMEYFFQSMFNAIISAMGPQSFGGTDEAISDEDGIWTDLKYGQTPGKSNLCEQLPEMARSLLSSV